MDNQSPSPFAKFKFQDSLRKYENLPRKKVKKSPQKSSQCLRRHCRHTSQQRISRIFDTHRKYFEFSIEKQQANSKQKSIKKETLKKEISEFMDQKNVINEVETNSFWDKIQLKNKDTELINNYEAFREKVIESFEQNNNKIRLKIKAEIQEEQNNLFQKVDNHIESIESLRQELKKQILSILSEELLLEKQEEEHQIQVHIKPSVGKDQLIDEEEVPISQEKLQQRENEISTEQIPSETQILKETILFNGGRVKVEAVNSGQYLVLSARILIRVMWLETIQNAKKRYPLINKRIFKTIYRIIQKDKNSRRMR